MEHRKGPAIAAIYARISKADGKQGKMDQSVENQIHLAQEYIRKDPQLSCMQIQVFEDQGYTGTNMDRPSVRKLLAGIYLGRIQALVVKDFSRLSRNHIQLSELRENTFLRYPIIFISIGDRYDSRKREASELCAGFRSIFNEYYCRDVSRKVKHVLAAKKQNGEYAVARVPYGYRKEGSRGLVICPQEAALVRVVFGQAALGRNTAQIARWLNQQEVESRKQGQAEEGNISRQKGEDACRGQWQPAQIWRMLNNPVYMGTHIWHKYESEYRNGFARRCVDRQDWHWREESHPAIISQEEFIKVWNLQKRTAGYGVKKGKRHIFHGITRCGYCRNALCRHRRKKEWLVCRERHGGRQDTVSWRKLFKICAERWFDGEAPHMQEWEMELFLHQFIREVVVGPGKQVWIKCKVCKE